MKNKKNIYLKASLGPSGVVIDFDDLAKQLGVKRYSPEYNRFLYVNLLGVPAEDYDKADNKIDCLRNKQSWL